MVSQRSRTFSGWIWFRRPRNRDERCNLERNGCPQERGDLRAVVGGRYLDHVAADELEPSGRAHHVERFEACKSARHRRTRSRRKGRIDAIDVKSEIARIRARDLVESL